MLCGILTRDIQYLVRMVRTKLYQSVVLLRVYDDLRRWIVAFRSITKQSILNLPYG